MKKLILALLLGFPMLGFSQAVVIGPDVSYVTTNPVGVACSPGPSLTVYAGGLYVCGSLKTMIPVGNSYLVASGTTVASNTLSPIVLFTAPVAGWYRICGSINVTVPGGTSAAVTENYGNTINGAIGNGEFHTLVPSVTATATGNGSSCSGDIFAGANSQLEYYTTVTGTVGSLSYLVEASLSYMHQ
jgi:hypothetical protein